MGVRAEPLGGRICATSIVDYCVASQSGNTAMVRGPLVPKLKTISKSDLGMLWVTGNTAMGNFTGSLWLWLVSIRPFNSPLAFSSRLMRIPV